MKYLLVDLDHGAARILSRFESPFHLREGIFSLPDRLRRLHPDAELVYLHPDAGLEILVSRHFGFEAFRAAYPHINLDEFAREILFTTNTSLPAWPGVEERRAWAIRHLASHFPERMHFSSDPMQMLDVAPARIAEDLFLLDRADFHHADAQLIGARHDLWIHRSISVPPGVVFDTTDGPVVLDRDCHLSPFTFIRGPFYAAPECHMDNARITGGTILGEGCRVGGEIENCIFGRFSNKHHEGFVGHSLIGNWVNLGALTTTSDLKNNYGHVRLQLPSEIFPHRASTYYTLDTGRIKFGSIVGDCVKTAIGTMLNTGTVLDAASSVFAGAPPPYLPSLSWGLTGHAYRPGRFLEDSEKIFARRQRPVPDVMKEMVKLLAHLR